MGAARSTGSVRLLLARRWAATRTIQPKPEISRDGVDVDVCFTDVAGRPVQVRIDDRNGRPPHRGTLLAPVGAVIEDPASLSLFVMGAATWCAGPAPSTSASTSPASGRGRALKGPGGSASTATRPSLGGSGPPSGARMSALFRTWPATYRWTGTVTLGRRGSLVVVAHPPRATRLPVSCGTARRVRCRAGWCGGPGRRRPRPGGRPRAWPGCWTRSS
jgi:hypothetical protein